MNVDRLRPSLRKLGTIHLRTEELPVTKAKTS